MCQIGNAISNKTPFAYNAFVLLKPKSYNAASIGWILAIEEGIPLNLKSIL